MNFNGIARIFPWEILHVLRFLDKLKKASVKRENSRTCVEENSKKWVASHGRLFNMLGMFSGGLLDAKIH